MAKIVTMGEIMLRPRTMRNSSRQTSSISITAAEKPTWQYPLQTMDMTFSS